MALERSSLDGLRIDRPEVEERTGRGRLWIALALVAVAGLVAWWWLSRPRAAEVKVAEARQGEGGAAAGAVLNASGYVTARRQATVSSKITAKVTEVLVEEGMAIREGQVLARLDARLQEKGGVIVRVAAHKRLPQGAVQKLVAELEKRRRSGAILEIKAEVNEKSS